MKRRKWIYIVLIIYILFIFSNSLMIGSVSSSNSGHFTRLLLGLVNRAGFTIDFDLFHHYVRKTAHFSEYAVLGFLTLFTCSYAHPVHKRRFFFGVMIAVPCFDEFLQLFVPDRCGAFTDCLIDMSGYLTGAFAMYILLLIVRDLHSRLHHQ